MTHTDKLMNIVNIISKHKGLINASDVDGVKGIKSLITGKFESSDLTGNCFKELKGETHYIDMMYTTETNLVYVFV